MSVWKFLASSAGAGWFALSAMAAFAEPPPQVSATASTPLEARAPAGRPAESATLQPTAVYAAPNENHKLLKSLVGTWELTSRTWKGAPSAEPVLTKGVAEKHMILGDRFLQEDYHSIFLGQPYVGLGTTGFDTAKQKFVNTWVCNLSTGVIVSEGAMDIAGRELVMTGTGLDRQTQQLKTYRMALRIESVDRHIITYFEAGPDGKEKKIVEVVYTRKK